MKKTVSGFTIVELLIVVVVIAILASISAVAFTGIQNRAHDTAVQNDLAWLKKRLELYYVDNGAYATTGAQIESLGFKASIGSYMTEGLTYNLLYCRPYAPTTQWYSVIAKSKSGKNFIISKENSVKEYTGQWRADQADTCVDSGSPAGTGGSNYRGYAPDDTVNGPWRPWVR